MKKVGRECAFNCSRFLGTKNYNMIEHKYMTVREYADKYGISLKTVYNQIGSGKIPKERVKIILSTTLIKV